MKLEFHTKEIVDWSKSSSRELLLFDKSFSVEEESFVQRGGDWESKIESSTASILRLSSLDETVAKVNSLLMCPFRLLPDSKKKHPRGDAISPRGYLVCVWAT